MKRQVLGVLILLALSSGALAISPGWHAARPITDPFQFPFADFPAVAALESNTGAFFEGAITDQMWWYRGSEHNGVFWPITSLVGGFGPIAEPYTRLTAVALTGNTPPSVHVAVQHYGVMGRAVTHVRSEDGGQNWINPQTFNPPSGLWAFHPDLAIDPLGTPYGISWICAADDYGSTFHVFYRHSSDGGQTWVPPNWLDPVQLTGIGGVSTSGHSPSIAVGKDASNDWRVYAIYTGPEGVIVRNWRIVDGPPGIEEILNPDANGGGRDPDIAANARNKVIATFTCIDNDPIHHNDDRVRTRSVVPPEPNYHTITSVDLGDGVYQQAPRVALDDFAPDSIHVVWQDNRRLPADPTKTDIFYNCSSDQSNWLAYDDNLTNFQTNAPYTPANPDIAVNWITTAGYPYRHVVWQGPYDPPNNIFPQIWYRKKAETGNPNPPTSLQADFIDCPSMMGHPYLWWDASTSSDVACYSIYRRPLCIPPCPFAKVDSFVQDLSWTDLDPAIGCCASHEYYVTAVDYGENESDPSNHAFLGCPMWWFLMASVDAGTPEVSPYTLRRAGYYAWGGTPDSTADFDPDSLVYRFTRLNPDSNYVLGIGYFQGPTNAHRRVSLSVNGVQIHGSIALPARPGTGYFKVPKPAYRSGILTLTFKREQGPDVAVTKLALYRGTMKGGGPQSDGLVKFISTNTLLGPPHPNPTTGATEVSYHLPGPGVVSLKVYNIAGQAVRTLVDGSRLGGDYQESWDGKDGAGQNLPSGVYFIRLSVGAYQSSRRVVLAR